MTGLLDQFDFSGTPRLVKPRLQRSIQAQHYVHQLVVVLSPFYLGLCFLMTCACRSSRPFMITICGPLVRVPVWGNFNHTPNVCCA